MRRKGASQKRAGREGCLHRPSAPTLRCLGSRASIASFPEIDSNSFVRVSWTERRSSQSVLKNTNSEHSLEGLMLKLKL